MAALQPRPPSPPWRTRVPAPLDTDLISTVRAPSAALSERLAASTRTKRGSDFDSGVCRSHWPLSSHSMTYDMAHSIGLEPLYACCARAGTGTSMTAIARRRPPAFIVLMTCPLSVRSLWPRRDVAPDGGRDIGAQPGHQLALRRDHRGVVGASIFSRVGASGLPCCTSARARHTPAGLEDAWAAEPALEADDLHGDLVLDRLARQPWIDGHPVGRQLRREILGEQPHDDVPQRR